MPDLVDKFFQEDLTEAEQQALSDALLNSDEAALKFEARARDFYLTLGFLEVEAHWPSHGNPPWQASHGISWGKGLGVLHHFGHLGPWIWPSIFVVATTSAVVAWHFSQKVSVKTLPMPPAAIATPLAASPAAVATVDILPKPASPVIPKSIAAPVPALSQPPLVPKVTPIQAGGGTTLTFSNLSVVVGQAKAGFITVRVLEPEGEEITTLYKGNLGPGDWVFQWDGKLTNGSPAPAGYYQIEIQAGSFIQHKDIQIQ